MEHFTKAKLTHIFWQNLLESYDIPRLFRRSVQFLSKTVILFLDKHIKIHKSHCSSISSDILWHRIVLFVPRFRINAHTFHFFRRTPAGYCPAPANAATFPCHTPPRSPCKCRPKCPIFAARSAAKDFAACDSCPLLGKSASSHPHFLQIVLLNRYVTGSMFGFSCNDAKIRHIPPIYPFSLLTGP